MVFAVMLLIMFHILSGSCLLYTSTDWQDEIFKTSFSTDHNVNVSGAIPHMPYRVSVSYTNENGILKTSNMERLTGAISLNPNFFDKKLNIQLNVKGIYNTCLLYTSDARSSCCSFSNYYITR